MKVLYVEDNQQDAELAKLMLARSGRGIETTTVPTVKAALEQLAPHGAGTYDLILTDVHLPDGSGLDILRHIRERGLLLPVVMITGAADGETALNALRSGADDYIGKRDNYLQQLPGMLELAVRRQREVAARRSRPLRVLYAEHNTDDVELARRHLARAAAHIKLEAVPTGSEALARLVTPESHGDVDVLMLDFQLPGWNALDLIKELLLVRGLDLPIIVITEHGSEELVTQCLRLGATDYVFKTAGYLERLPNTLENAWFRAQMRRDQATLSRLAAFPENNPNPVFELAPDARATYHNQAASKLAEELGLAHPTDLLASDVADNVRACLQTGAAISHRETTCAGRVLAWSYCPVLTQAVVHCYADDVTRRHQLEERLRQSQKLEAIGQLAGGVAHDFNNMLTVIAGNVQALREESALDAPQRERIDEISFAVERATGLTRQLLAFGRRSSMQRAPLDLNDVVTQVTKLLSRTLGELIELVVEPSAAPAVVFADAGMLEQVVMNLTLNARDAMTQGGRLTLSISRVEAPCSTQEPSTSTSQRDFALLRVSDTGTGIAPEALPHIFEPFFTTKGVGRGTGLGLPTVQGIVQQHGGFLRVDTELGRGTSIEVYLPALSAAAPVTDRTSAPAIQARGGTERILVVEDEAQVRNLICRSLSRLGYEVHAAANGVEAIEKYRAAGHIDLLLTDLIMPGGLNGLDLVRRLRHEQPRLPVVFNSGYEAQVLGPNFTYGALESFLAKPYELAQLCQVVREILDRRLVG